MEPKILFELSGRKRELYKKLLKNAKLLKLGLNELLRYFGLLNTSLFKFLQCHKLLQVNCITMKQV